MLCNTMAWRMADLFLPLLAQANGVQEFQMGFFSTANTLAMILALIPAGILADAVHQKKGVLMIATFLQVMVQFLFPLARSALEFLLISILQGVTLALYLPAVLALTTFKATVHTSGRYISLYTAILTAGMAIGAYFGGLLADLFSLEMAYLVFGFVVLVSTALLVLPLEQPGPLRYHGTLKEKILNEVKGLVGGTTRQLRPLYVGILLRAIGFFSFYFYFPLYVSQLGLPNTLLGAADALNTATSLVSIVFLGYIVERSSAKALLLAGFYGHVVLTVLFSIIVSAEQLFFVMIVAGVVWAAMKIGALTLITQQALPGERGKQNSLESTSYNAGRIIGTPVNGYLIQAAGGFSLAYCFTGVMCLLASIYLHVRLPSSRGQNT
ncbi:MAG: MFS transporter [Candidatus Ranarchaeia archaeon]